MKTVGRTIAAFAVCGVLLSLTTLTDSWAGPRNRQKKPTVVDASAGKKLFERHCALCHGIDGKGGRGPALNRARLTHAPDDAALKSLIADGIPPSMPEGWLFDDDDLANLVAFVRSLSKLPADPIPGDANRGAGVYAKSGCSSCHILEGVGTGYGPELTGIGERRNAAFLKKVVSRPSTELPENFMFVRAITASGEIVEGIRANEDTFTIQVKDAGEHFHSLRKDELRDLHKLQGETPMPAFEGVLSAKELEDLVAYLASRRTQP
jgi:cytochrome c oxidase cbb3-type subunit III